MITSFQGHVTSYFGTAAQKYTAFQAHQTDVRALLVRDPVIVATSQDAVAFASRQGFVQQVMRFEFILAAHAQSSSTRASQSQNHR